MPRSPRKISILLVDDHPIVREGLRSCLDRHKHLHVIAEAADGAEAIALARAWKPAVILMDINLPRVNGLEATAVIHREIPSAKVLALTVHRSREYVKRMKLAGASGYVLKDAPPAELVEAITAVARGETWFVDASQTEDAAHTAQPPLHRTPLTGREQQVLSFVAEGLTSKEIARRLGIGVRTVETYRDRLSTKLRISSPAAMTRYAVEHQLVRSPRAPANP
jgi:two-component system, NarL family, nitrate/nitrite response regulator NarL